MAEQLRIVREVAEAVGLAEGEHGVRSILATAARLEPVSTRRLARVVDLPVPIVASVCGELRRRGIVAAERPTRLTARGRALFAVGALQVPAGGTCRRCEGRGFEIRGETASLLSDMRRIGRLAPPPQIALDQCHCTPETKLRRVLALHEADALVGRRVLVLGDDDLTSLAIDRVVRRFGSAASVARLAVVDIDPAVVAHIADALADAPFEALAVEHDVREPLPAELCRAFDTVVTDPPYTVEGATLFLSRAVDALAGSGGDVLLSFGSRRPQASFLVQRRIAEMGFAVVRLLRDFNDYVGAGALGGTSNLYHLSAVAPLPLVVGRYGGPLYTADTVAASVSA